MYLFIGYINLFIGYMKEIIFYIILLLLYFIKKTLMGLWMQENMENDGSDYAIKFYISMICKNNKLFTYCIR